MTIQPASPAKRGEQFNSGFSLIEILLSMFFIATIVTILLTTSGSLFTRRRSDQQAIASKAASKEIERLRGLPYSGTNSLLSETPPDFAWPSGCKSVWPDYAHGGDADNDNDPSDSDNYLKDLKSGRLCRELYDYSVTTASPYGNPTPPPGPPYTKIAGIKITILWNNDNGADQSLTMDTLISENGLQV